MLTLLPSFLFKWFLAKETEKLSSGSTWKLASSTGNEICKKEELTTKVFVDL